MKFTITFKSPDGVSRAIDDLDEEDRPAALAFISQWVGFQEYITVEFDMEKKTARVLP